jgi:hypothetical protein
VRFSREALGQRSNQSRLADTGSPESKMT